MTSRDPVVTLSPRDYDAVLFDLDGVLTRTASVHAAAWKRLFDAFLAHRAADTGAAFVPFDIDADYRRYVDGTPRYDGAAAFLASREIALPCGTPTDGPGTHTVHALGNLKDQYFLQHLAQHGVEPEAAAIALVRTLRAQEATTAVVSSSNHCAAVLEAAGMAPLFDARVDGMDITRLALRGKPAPDAFLEAARRVETEPARACSGREGLNLAGENPVVPIARFRHVAIPQFVTGNRTFFAWRTRPGCLEDFALLR